MLNKIEKLFGNREANLLGDLKKTAVMILLCEEEGKTSIVFEVRAFNLRHQPGDICLPGGKVEKGEMPEEASIRETMEELNLEKSHIKFIGNMDYIVTPYNFMIYPFVGKLNADIIVPNKSEVDHIFKVPIEFFIENSPTFHELSLMPNPGEKFPYHLIRNGRDYKFRTGKVPEYFYKYKDYVIWGFTALIIKRFIEVLEEEG